MGVYSKNTHISGDDTVVAAEGYHGEVGASSILFESVQNDMILFEALIGNDFTEAALNESSTDAEIIAVAESASVGFVDKIKEFLKKVWAKIKGLFESFMARLKNIIVRDNKKYVDMYKAKVLAKDLSKMTYKTRTSDDAKLTAFYLAADTIYKAGGDAEKIYQEAIGGDADKVLSHYNSADYADKMRGKLLGGSSSVEAGEFRKEAFDHVFEDEEEIEGLSSSKLTEIISELSVSSKNIKGLETSNKAVNTYYTKALQSIDKIRGNIAKLIPGKEGASGEVDFGDGDKKTYTSSTHAALGSKAVSCVYAAMKAEQTVITAASSIIIEMAKFDIKQLRSIFAKAAAYNPKSVKENATLLEAVGDESDHEMEMAFEGKYAY